ncbi:hypothetical protein [Mesorhizobium sp. M1403]|uniref:hypothetical protein n=1 Tax=Mesorhizobium sp. M1403 TaxID=2957097 RepID=UPI0033392C6C
MSTLVDPELKRLVLDDALTQGATPDLICTIETMLDDGRLLPVRLPDGSLGVRVGKRDVAPSAGMLQ